MDAGDKYLNVRICLTQLNAKNYSADFDLAINYSTKILHSYKIK